MHLLFRVVIGNSRPKNKKNNKIIILLFPEMRGRKQFSPGRPQNFFLINSMEFFEKAYTYKNTLTELD